MPQETYGTGGQVSLIPEPEVMSLHSLQRFLLSLLPPPRTPLPSLHPGPGLQGELGRPVLYPAVGLLIQLVLLLGNQA